MSNKPIIGITMGDPSGIGPEVTLKAVSKLKSEETSRVLVIGSGYVLSRMPLKRRYDFELVDLDNVPRANFAFGKISPLYGRAAVGYINKALELLTIDRIHALVTAPLSKEAVNLAGFKFLGHTEYLAAKTKTSKFAMMFVADKLKVTLVTRHIPLRKVVDNISSSDIIDAIMLTADFLKKYYRISSPRIAICGLNPHAGEGGRLGREEETLIGPAIKQVKKYHRHIFGPLSSDTVFLQAAGGRYDAVIAMYHDQGMIAVKTLAFTSSVNVTLGLPFIRTAPCHGTAFDIAGKNMADHSAMLAAIRLAISLSQKSSCEI